MPTAIIQVKQSGPYKDVKRSQYGWVKDVKGEFWSVTKAQCEAAKPGQTYTVQWHMKGEYKEVDSWRLADTQEMLEGSVNIGRLDSEPIAYKNGAEVGLDKKLEQQWAEKIFDAFLNGHTENQIREARQVGQKLAREAVINQDGPQKPNAAPAGTFQDSGEADEGVWLK